MAHLWPKTATGDPNDEAPGWDHGPDLGLWVERVTGIEPALSAWEADVLPLNYTRERTDYASTGR